MDYSMPGFPVYHKLPEIAQTHVHPVGDAIQTSHPLSSPFPPAFNLSSIRVFSNELVLHIRWPKYWSFSFSISPSNEHSGLISFTTDWFDILPGQGILKSLVHHHRSKASILWYSAFIMVQLSHPYMTTGKAIALTGQTIALSVVNYLIDTETPTRWKTFSTWWPDYSHDISCHNSENWPQGNGNKWTHGTD